MKGALYLEFSGKKALVVGSGKVGLRRAETLAGYGCSVRCLSPENISDSHEGVSFYQGIYEAEYLDEMDLAVAATNDRTVNQKILSDCRRRNILCNVADDPDHSDFIFPAVLSRGDLDIAVTTKGASPMLTKQILRELSELYGEEFAERTRLLKILRQKILENGEDPEIKRKRLRAFKNMTIEELKIEVEKQCV